MSSLANVVAAANQSGQLSHGMHILLVYTLLALAPAMLVLCTSFTRILVVLAFLRQALGIPTIPPNMVLIPLAMLLTLLSMGPILDDVYGRAVAPAMDGKLTPLAAYQEAAIPLREFMLRNTKERDLLVLGKAARLGPYVSLDQVPLRLIIPAFCLSELRTAFRMGFTLFMTFLTVDLVVAGLLSALGLMMVPPMSVSLPLKLLLFVLVDGWTLICGSLISSVH
ncbi:MAG: flagellar type III secretion system pore protein FliP [Vulcanimicrobiota bacterium]